MREPKPGRRWLQNRDADWVPAACDDDRTSSGPETSPDHVVAVGDPDEEIEIDADRGEQWWCRDGEIGDQTKPPMVGRIPGGAIRGIEADNRSAVDQRQRHQDAGPKDRRCSARTFQGGYADEKDVQCHRIDQSEDHWHQSGLR